MKDRVRYQFLQQKKKIMLLLLSMLMIGLFSIKAIISFSDITTNEILSYPSPHSGTKDRSCYYCHSLRNNPWSDNDDDHDNEEDGEVYDEEDRKNEYEREDT
ncbi:MAG: hypothetical protein F9K48_09315 [Candidatus Brocadia sp.]|nr:MAG: hypothetical protein F9K48_09315 [Candidatus Brocadia sp.]